MSKPKHLEGLRLLPPVEVLVERLHKVDEELAQLEASQSEGLSERAAAGTRAHIAALTRKRAWYLSRIRSVRPVTSLDVSVAEDISSEDRMS